MDNNVKMIKTDPDTLDLLFKLKGWHLQRGEKVSNSDVIRRLIKLDAKRKGINNYQGEKKEEDCVGGEDGGTDTSG